MRLRPAATLEDTELLARIADTCWRYHYTPIIGEAQVDYMLERFQSATAIAEQITKGRHYYLIEGSDSDILGYLAIDEFPDHLFLSKLYILPDQQRRGIGEWAITELIGLHPQQAIQLTVNKHNHQAIAFYQKTGFTKQDPVVADIGNGFVMDDWKMVRNASPST